MRRLLRSFRKTNTEGRRPIRALLSVLLFIFLACSRPEPVNDLVLKWDPLKQVNTDLPQSIRVFIGENRELPVRAWRVDIDLNDASINPGILVSDDSDRRSSMVEFYERTDPLVLVNGGYFLMHMNPTSHVGLLKVNSELIEPASPSILRLGRRYFTARGAVGFNGNRMDIGWVSTRNDSMFEFQRPLTNRLNKPVKNLTFDQAVYWDYEHALNAGPVLLSGDSIHITVDEEVFFATKIPGVHPRTAIGYTSDNRMIIVVVDGRQPTSRGVYLEELASIMKQAGCYEALNLDGGGSSQLLVNGILLNNPSGTGNREVMSTIGIFKND